MKVSYAGVDWLTMTTKDEGVGRTWWSIYAKYRRQKEKEGDTAKAFHNGFYAGEKIGHLRWGYSEKIGYLLVASGRDAELMYTRLQPAKHKVTRLDLCFDFQLETPEYMAEELFKVLEEKNVKKKRKCSLFQGSDGGTTFYLGSRQSTQYGRVYDKGIQSGRDEKGLLWRAEVEYKKPLSGLLAKKISAVKSEERTMRIVDTVAEWFAERGAELFKKEGTSYPFHVSAEARITTADRKLAWLSSQVSPTVVTLIEAGYGRQVLDCLLLDTKRLNKAMIAKS